MEERDLIFLNELTKELRLMLIDVKDEEGNYKECNKIIWEIGERLENFKNNLKIAQDSLK